MLGASPVSASGRPSCSHALLARICVMWRSFIAAWPAGLSSGSSAVSSSSRAMPACAAACWACASARTSVVDVVSRTPSRRITMGRVSPCSSRVATVTKKARKTSVSRSGTVGGMTNAAARVTTPRIPVQEITAGTCQGGYGSFLRMPRNSARGR